MNGLIRTTYVRYTHAMLFVQNFNITKKYISISPRFGENLLIVYHFPLSFTWFNCSETFHCYLGGVGRERKREREGLEEGCKETESKENRKSEKNENKEQEGQVRR